MDPFERECRSYTRYLTGQPPTDYVIAKYRDFHQKSDGRTCLGLDPFDQFLVDTSARSPFWARLADSYASRFRPQSSVRRKLVLTLALLECVPPSFETLDAVNRGGALAAVWRLGFGAVLYAICVLISLILFTPVRLGLGLVKRSRQAAVLER
jgi:hypothetical protein